MSNSLFSTTVTVSEGTIKWPRSIPAPGLQMAPPNEKNERQSEATFHPVIQELQQIIEGDQDLYTGFCQMFEQIPNDPKYDVDPLGTPQVS